MGRQIHHRVYEEGGRSRFGTTRWSLVAAAGQNTSAESQAALATLCNLYWYPLYAYSRRCGMNPDAAADLTQGFFVRLLEQKIVRRADARLGKFRCYLLGAFKHYLSHEWVKARAQKRGGGRRFIALDARDAETRYGLEPSHDLTPDRVFDKQWAVRLLEVALEDLGSQCARDGKAHQFERVKSFLAGGTGSAYRKVGEELGLAEGAVRVLVHRLRRRYRDLLRKHIRLTVESAEQVEEEVQHLFAAIGA